MPLLSRMTQHQRVSDMNRITHNGAQIGFQPHIRKGAFFEAAWLPQLFRLQPHLYLGHFFRS